MPPKIAQLILLVGDPFLRRKKLTRIIEDILPNEQDRSFNLLRIDLKESGLISFLTQVKSFPMMGDRQLFVIEQLPKLKKDEIALLKEYLENPFRSSYIVISLDQIEEGHALSQLTQSFGQRIECASNDKRASLDFVHERLKKEGKTISKEAWQFLEEKTGGNLTLLDSCIEKMLLYSGEANQISLEMITQLADQFLIYDAYDLTDAICAKNPDKALRVLRFLYDLEESAIMVIGLIHWQLKRIWQGKVLLEEKGENELVRTLRISAYRLPTFLNQIRKFTYLELSRAIDQLFQIDRKIKTGQIRDKEAIESFVIQLASPQLIASSR